MRGHLLPLLFAPAWVGLYWLMIGLFVKLPEWLKPRLRWLTEGRVIDDPQQRRGERSS